MGRAVIAVLLVGVAYGVAWMSNQAVDDPCLSAYGREIDRHEHVERWFPPRTDCRVTTPGNGSRVASGSSEVSLTMFTLTLVVGVALLAGAAFAVRAAVVLAAGAAGFVVIFIV